MDKWCFKIAPYDFNFVHRIFESTFALYFLVFNQGLSLRSAASVATLQKKNKANP